MTWPTVRRHPRSCAEAFPAERAVAVEVYRSGRRMDRVIVAIAALTALLLLTGVL